jgi:hypothetical protein
MCPRTRLGTSALILIPITALFVTATLHGQPTNSAPTTQSGTTQAGGHREVTSRPASWLPHYPGPWDAALHLARSKDGLKFEESAEPIIHFAAAPTMARLPGGPLLLVFEHYPRTDRRSFGRLGFSVSADSGKTWSDPQPLEIEGLGSSASSLRSPALATRPDGSLQLFFICRNRGNRRSVLCADVDAGRTATSGPARASSQPAGARDKVEPSGSRFSVKLPDRVVLAEKAVLVDDLAVTYIGQECHLFGTLSDIGGQRYHGTSADGRRFHRLDNLMVGDVGTGGTVVTLPNGLRFYGSSREGMVSAISTDAKKWSREPGLRLSGGEDPAVIALADGSWLATCARGSPVTRARRRPGQKEQETPADAATARTDRLSGAEPSGEDGQVNMAAVDGGAAGEPWAAEEAYSDEATGSEAEDGSAAPRLPVPGEPGEPEDVMATVGNGDVADEADFPGFACTESGVPIPDFVHRVDYLAWFEAQHDPTLVADNSWDYYAAFMFDPQRGPLGKTALPDFLNINTDTGQVGPPAPWNPAEHPEWERTHTLAIPYVEQFAEAASHRDYVRPVLLADPDFTDGEASTPQATPGDDRFNKLLINIMLPDLAAHRAMVKQTMADAWRAPDGKPDPQAMLDAFDTCLSSAGHLGDSDILIERLVCVADKGLVERDARVALQQGVFSPDQMEAALETFIARDRPISDPTQWMKGEAAMTLDATQYLFGVGEEDGGTTVKPDRLERLFSIMGEEGQLNRPTPEELAAATPERVTRNFLDYYQHFTDMARQGYPQVKAKDIDDVARPHIEDNWVSRCMLPSLSRAYQIANRAEASRRATQLSYAVHLHKARTGQWPQSLDELPPRYTQAARTDPFSGQDFVYRVTGDGFTLYSASENGSNDGGRHHPRWSDAPTPEDPGDDHVFWPPQ